MSASVPSPSGRVFIIRSSKTHLLRLCKSAQHISHNQHSTSVFFHSHSPFISVLSSLISCSICLLFLCLSLCASASPFSLSLSFSILIWKQQVKAFLTRLPDPTGGVERDRRERSLFVHIEAIHDLLQVGDVFIAYSSGAGYYFLLYISCKSGGTKEIKGGAEEWIMK